MCVCAPLCIVHFVCCRPMLAVNHNVSQPLNMCWKSVSSVPVSARNTRPALWASFVADISSGVWIHIAVCCRPAVWLQLPVELSAGSLHVHEHLQVGRGERRHRHPWSEARHAQRQTTCFQGSLQHFQRSEWIFYFALDSLHGVSLKTECGCLS